jgi:hypothetical protein
MLTQQKLSAWSFELDLRPYGEGESAWHLADVRAGKLD